MGEAVDESLSHLVPSDIQAMVAYLRSIPAVRSTDLAAVRSLPAAAQPLQDEIAHSNGRGQEIYEGTCAGCHGWTGIGSVIPSANLIGARAVNDPTATNVVQIIIHGGEHYARERSATMPSFGTLYSDADVAALANYVTARFGAASSDVNASQVEKLRSED
jgi:mono/diheme cytochrome c family protein